MSEWYGWEEVPEPVNLNYCKARSGKIYPVPFFQYSKPLRCWFCGGVLSPPIVIVRAFSALWGGSGEWTATWNDKARETLHENCLRQHHHVTDLRIKAADVNGFIDHVANMARRFMVVERVIGKCEEFESHKYKTSLQWGFWYTAPDEEMLRRFGDG